MATLEEQQERARKMGIPMPVTQHGALNEGAVEAIPVTHANASMHERLRALKKGANKTVIKDMIQSKGKNGQTFEGIPEVKQRRAPAGHPSNKISPGKSVVPKGFDAPPSGEFAALEAMMGGNTSAPINMNPAPAVTGSQPELTVQQDGYGPSYNPESMLAEKRSKMQTDNEYLQYAMNPEQQAQQMQQTEGTTNQEQFDFQNMQKMMQEIAKSTMSEVLNNYTEKNKDKLVYENYTKTKDGAQVIKTQDGKLFKLVPVKLKKA